MSYPFDKNARYDWNDTNDAFNDCKKNEEKKKKLQSLLA